MLELSSSLRKKVHPWKGGPFAAPPVDLKKVSARLRKVRELQRYDSSHLEIDSAYQPALKARWEGPVEEIERVIPEVEAGILCLLGGCSRNWERAHEIGADMVHLWCAKGAVESATRALVLSAQYTEVGKRLPGQNFSNSCHPYLGAWRALRGHLARTPQPDYLSALAAAKELAWDRVGWLVAYAFPTEPELSRKAAAEVLALFPSEHGIGLLASVEDGELFARLADHLKPYMGDLDWTHVKMTDYLPTAVARLGDSSFEGLRVLAESVQKVGYKRALAELLAQLSHPAVGPWLAQRVKDRAFGPVAHAYASKS
jgi:hypothetical protein